MNNNGLALAPILLTISRGSFNNCQEPIQECVFRGLISVMDADGQEIFSLGDTSLYTHMRSTAKPWQILPLLKEKGVNHFALKDIALFMSSHGGQKIHTERVAEILQAHGFLEKDLRCGIHPPTNINAQFELWQSQKKASQLHNNCSGKHCAMLLYCQSLALDLLSYESPTHPLQLSIKKCISDLSGVDEAKIPWGFDGCSMPSFAMPLKNIAKTYATLALAQKDTTLPFESELKTIWQAATKFPEFLAGDDKFDTHLMKEAKGKIFCKTGADGMQALAVLPCPSFPKGLGIAIKMVDGDAKQVLRPLIAKILLERLGFWPKSAKLLDFMPKQVNFRGKTFGSILEHF